MNWLLVIAAGLLVVLGLYGYWKGFIRIAFSFAALVISIILVSVMSPYVGDFIQNKTPIYDSIKNTCVEFLESGNGETSNDNHQEVIADSFLPASLKKALANNNNPETYDLLGAAGFYEYVGGYMALLVINAIAFVVTFVIVSILLRMGIHVLDIIAKLPVIRSFNRMAGLLVGVAEALVIIWIGFIVITMFSSHEFGRLCFSYINRSVILSFLYDYNLLLAIVMSFI